MSKNSSDTHLIEILVVVERNQLSLVSLSKGYYKLRVLLIIITPIKIGKSSHASRVSPTFPVF